MYPLNREKYKINHLALKMARENNLRIGEVKSKLAKELKISYRHLNRLAKADQEIMNHRQLKTIKEFFGLNIMEEIEQ